MKFRIALVAVALASFAAACSQQSGQDTATTTTEPGAAAPAGNEGAQVTDTSSIEAFEISPGLSARILQAGSGEVAEVGDNVVVHYTGWLFDESAENNRGAKFDSSVDRGEHFQFPLGAGRVIKGWDQGVAGMAIGEVRELTIAPEMAYGDRSVGDVIPSGSTLVFEVELFDLQDLGAPATQ